MEFDKPQTAEPHVMGSHLEPDVEMRDGEEANPPAEGKRETKGDNLW
jgi:hypothetical protein